MTTELGCWKCGASIEDLPMPLSREAECKFCRAQLHVCKLCEFYDPHVADQCTEPIADFVKEKERANFCDYFKPVSNAYHPKDDSQIVQSTSELNELFGLEQGDESSKMTEAEKAKSKLNDLFK
jgi:hypothetical protein